MMEELRKTIENIRPKSILEKMLDGLDINAFESQLKALPLDDLMRLASDTQNTFEDCDIPDAARPAVEAVVRELHCRNDLMRQEAEDLNRQIDALHKEIREKDREYLDLLHENHRLELQAALREQELRERESTGYYKVRRNDPCPCGSGKKYKHCCGM